VKKKVSSFPDTNIIIRYLTNDDPLLFKRSKEFFDKVKSSETKAVILESVIAECVYVLTKIYRVPNHKAAGSLIDILRYKGVVNKDRKELIDDLTLFTEERLAIVDCILYVKAKSGGDCLISFDSDLNKLHSQPA
jgi:predicted nucleic acid-binding protein